MEEEKNCKSKRNHISQDCGESEDKDQKMILEERGNGDEGVRVGVEEWQ